MTEPTPDREARRLTRVGVALRVGSFVATLLLMVGSVLTIHLLSDGGTDAPHTAGDDPGRPATTSHRGEGGDGAAAASPTTTWPKNEPTREPVLALADHPLLQNPEVGLPNLTCELPAWQNDPETAETFFRAATACLDKAWEPLLTRYDLPFEPPELRFPTDEQFSSRCGTITVGQESAAYYCEGQLFLPFHGLQTEQYHDNIGVYLALLAHEYGHHVQELAGIMDAAWQQIYQAGEHTDEGMEMSRRKELQAQCFSGMFLGSHVDQGSVTRQAYEAAWHDQETRGDDTAGQRRHGTNQNYAMWWRIGAADNRITDCNTFTAPAAEVS